MDNNKGFKSFLTIRYLLMLLTAICMILFFFPTFKIKVSMFGMEEKIRFGLISIVRGVRFEGSRIADPAPAALICLMFLIGIAVVLVLNLLKKMPEKPCAIVTAAIAGTDLLTWLIFRIAMGAAIKKELGSYGLSSAVKFRVTGWYVINFLLLLSIIALSLLVVIRILRMDGWLPFGSPAAVPLRPAGPAPSAGLKTGDPIGACPTCGGTIGYGSRVCAGCGTAVPQSMIDAAEAKAAAAAKPPLAFCPSCGAKIQSSDAFCASCGAKLK